MGGRYLGNLREAQGASGSSREYEETLGYTPPSLKNPIKTAPTYAEPGRCPHAALEA